MCALIADCANGEPAFRACADFATSLDVHVLGLDPFSALFAWTVDSVLGRPLLIFTVPRFLEIMVKERLDVFEGYVFFCAAAWRHVRGVFDAHLEDALEAGVAHSVGAG